MKKIIKYFILFFSFFLCFSVNAESVPNVPSNNIILYNLNDEDVIYEKNADERVNIASLTKIMTAIVAIENIDDYDKKILITSSMISNLDSDLSKVGFKAGDVVTYDDLLYGTLLKSGADATNILAYSISDSISNFVYLMNAKARELKMKNTHFSNTIGIEGENHYSSASDIMILLKYALGNNKFKKIFESESYISSNSKYIMEGPLKRIRNYEDSNMNYITGAKTGYTSKAGLCLASASRYNNINYILITIGASYENKMQNIEDSKNIYEYFFNNYEYKTILSKGEKMVSISTIYDETYDIVADKDVSKYLRKTVTESDLKKEYIGKEIIDESIHKGDEIGKYYIKYNDEVLYEEPIFSKTDVKMNLKYFFKKNIYLMLVFILFLALLFITIRIRKR